MSADNVPNLREAIARCLCRRKWDRPSAIQDRAEWQRRGFDSLDAAVDYNWSLYAGGAADAIIAGPLADMLSRARASEENDHD